MSLRGRWKYLYRAVDRNGKSVHSLLCADRTVSSAQDFFRQAVNVSGSPWPEKINLDGNTATHLALRLLGEEDSRWQSVTIRTRRYLNNIVEQDHRAIKQRCRPMLGLKSSRTAAVTFSGIELAHRIRKRQFTIAYDCNGRSLSLKELWAQALSGKSLSDNAHDTSPPLMHQISRPSPPRVRGERARLGVVRHPRRVSFGHNLYLLVTPKGGRLWHYRYRFQGREKLLSLGCYPDVPMDSARARQNAARRLLDLGVDPAVHRAELRQISAEQH